MKSTLIDATGERYGKLTVVGIYRRMKRKTGRGRV